MLNSRFRFSGSVNLGECISVLESSASNSFLSYFTIYLALRSKSFSVLLILHPFFYILIKLILSAKPMKTNSHISLNLLLICIHWLSAVIFSKFFFKYLPLWCWCRAPSHGTNEFNNSGINIFVILTFFLLVKISSILRIYLSGTSFSKAFISA